MADEPEQPLVAAPAGPRVLLVVDDESLERFGAITKHIVVGLADVAVRVTVLCRTSRSPSALELGPCMVVHDPPRRWIFGRGLPPMLVELIRDGRLDVVHCLSPALAEQMRRHAELARFPVAAHVTDGVDLERWVRLRRRLGAGGAPVWALPATPTLFKGVLDTRSVRSRFVKLVRLGIIGQTGAPIMAEPEHIPSVMVMTSLTERSGVESVLRAMQVVAGRAGEMVLLVLGKGPAERRFRSLAQELGLQAAVVFVGDLREWVEAMLGCDILLVPRRPGRWTSQVLEAMGAGRVILASRDNGEDYLVEDQTACLFAPDDVADLAQRWHLLVSEPAAAQRLGEAARQFVKKQHGPSAMIGALEELYAEVGAPSVSGLKR